MYATTGFPHHLHWSSDELANAVPRRLSELYRFDVDPSSPALECANSAPRRARSAQRQYVPSSTLPDMFRAN